MQTTQQKQQIKQNTNPILDDCKYLKMTFRTWYKTSKNSSEQKTKLRLGES